MQRTRRGVAWKTSSRVIDLVLRRRYFSGPFDTSEDGQPYATAVQITLIQQLIGPLSCADLGVWPMLGQHMEGARP